MTTLDGKSILIVGATGGLGREIATILAAAGARLVLSGRDETKLNALAELGTVVPADVLEPSTAPTLVASAVMVNGRLDGVINAAGVVAFGSATDVQDDALARLFAINTFAPIHLLTAARNALVESAEQGNEPFFVTITGVVSESPTFGLAAYSASKAALAAYTQVAAREMRRSGVRVIDARPGHTETGLAGHPITGTAPSMPTGYEPAAVAKRIVDAIVSGERDVPSSAFLDLGVSRADAAN